MQPRIVAVASSTWTTGPVDTSTCQPISQIMPNASWILFRQGQAPVPPRHLDDVSAPLPVVSIRGEGREIEARLGSEMYCIASKGARETLRRLCKIYFSRSILGIKRTRAAKQG
jgi:hypothetical protein